MAEQASRQETNVISDREFDSLPRNERAEIMREYGRTQGRDLSAHEAGLLADRNATNRLAEHESQAVAAHEGFAARGRGLGVYEVTPPWERLDSGLRQPGGRERDREAGS